ncbi:MAG: methionyl-tRNA formyltransferase [Candidatus Tantalella remota]|nr:methionyl-tRNA formyltransferase [Candidatus Tantalella remota]
MRIVFFGTGKFGIPSLEGLLSSSHEVAAVVTQPDRPKGRGWKLQPTEVKAWISSAAGEVKILQPENKGATDIAGELEKIEADVYVVIDYGRILKKEVLRLPAKYCVNLHPSLLPAYRGAAPVNRAILNGEVKTGITVFRMNERMDAGDIILQEESDVDPSDNALTLSERLSKEGASLLLEALAQIQDGSEVFTPQDETAVTFAPKLNKEEGKIDWSSTAEKIVAQVRGMIPWPGAYTFFNGKRLGVLGACVDDPEGTLLPQGGLVREGAFIVATGKGTVKIDILQPEGKKAMAAEDFLRGQNLSKGTVLG